MISSCLKRRSKKSIVILVRNRHLRNRVAICYYLLSYRWRESFVFHYILYKYYTLIYKIRLHLLHLRLDSDAVLSSLDRLHVSEAPTSDLLCNQGKSGHDNSGEIDLQWFQVVSEDIPRRVSLSSFGIATFGFESRCYYLTDEGRVLYLQYIIQMLYFNLQDPNLSTMISSCKRCSTKSIVLLLRTRQLWKQLALLFAEMFHKEFRPLPLESNRVAICYYLLDEGRVLYFTVI